MTALKMAIYSQHKAKSGMMISARDELAQPELELNANKD